MEQQELTQEQRNWAYCLDETGQKRYNNKCQKCMHECKQSFRAQIRKCPKYKKITA